MTTNYKPLPPGWAWTTLGEIAELVGGGTPSREVAEYFMGDIVWLTPTEIPKDRVAFVSDSRERITTEALRRSSARLIPAGSVLMTSRASIGYVAIAGREVTTNQGFASFVCVPAVHNGFLAYWLWANAETFRQHATGTTFKEITKSKLRPFALPLPPLAEQRRIVARLEELLTRLDAGVRALKQVQAKLKRYRAAVLKAACEGRLLGRGDRAPTDRAPTDRAPTDRASIDDEPAEKLLARILAERRARWEADLRAKGKDPSKARYAEPQPPNTANLPALPEGWCWATVEQIAEVRLGRQRSPARANGPNMRPYLRAANVTWDGLDLSDVKEMDFSPSEQNTYRLHDGDLLLSEASGSIGEVGKPSMWRGAIEECFFQNTLIRVRSHGLAPEYLYFHFLYDALTERFRKIAKGVGIHHLGAENLSTWMVSVPPLPEQRRIVAEVERRLSVVQELEHAVAANLARAGRLRQAVLRRAFEGRLVPQDPSDEPAEKLLEMIRAAREGAQKAPRPGAPRPAASRTGAVTAPPPTAPPPTAPPPTAPPPTATAPPPTAPQRRGMRRKAGR